MGYSAEPMISPPSCTQNYAPRSLANVLVMWNCVWILFLLFNRKPDEAIDKFWITLVSVAYFIVPPYFVYFLYPWKKELGLLFDVRDPCGKVSL